MTNPVEQTFNVRGLALNALAWGDPANPPLLALHGWMDNAMSFSELAPLLTSRYVIALDFAGHGKSQHRPEAIPYYISEYALDVAHVLAEISGDPVDVLGHSLGAGVATLVAGSTKHVRKLMLLDGIGPMSGLAGGSPDDLRKAIEQGIAADERTKTASKGYTLESLRERRQMASPEIAPAILAAMVERNAVESPDGWRWRTDAGLKRTSPMRYSEESVMAFLQRIDCPVLFLHAQQGLFKSNDDMINGRVACIAKLTRHNIDGAHHFHMGEQAATAASYIDQFLH